MTPICPILSLLPGPADHQRCLREKCAWYGPEAYHQRETSNAAQQPKPVAYGACRPMAGAPFTPDRKMR